MAFDKAVAVLEGAPGNYWIEYDEATANDPETFVPLLLFTHVGKADAESQGRLLAYSPDSGRHRGLSGVGSKSACWAPPAFRGSAWAHPAWLARGALPGSVAAGGNRAAGIAAP